NTLNTVNGAGTVLETHTVGYESAGAFVNGNRTSDAFAMNGPGSTACTGATPTCTATYSYDARDRLYRSTDGHGGTTTDKFDESNSADPSIRAGNITTETGGANGGFTATYNGNQLATVGAGGTTIDYWYDTLGRNTCVTTVAGSAASCNSGATGTSADPAVVTANSYDYLDRLVSAKSYSAGSLTDSAAYTYDALGRVSQETENHPTANINRTTDFSYLGLTGLVGTETARNTGGTTNTDTKSYTYDAYGHRIALADATTPSGGTTTTSRYTYGYDVHDSASLLVDESTGTAKASYGYTPYGASDPTLSKGDTNQNSPLNPYRYTGKRFDSGSKTLDMGSRRFNPGAGRFLQMDYFKGALNDLRLATDPLTQNRYSLGVGNPLGGIEVDGHMLVPDGGGGSSSSPTPAPSPTTVSSKTGDRTSIGDFLSSLGSTVHKLLDYTKDVVKDTAEKLAEEASKAGRTLATSEDPDELSAAGRALSRYGHDDGWARSVLDSKALRWGGRALVVAGFALDTYDNHRKGQNWTESATRAAVSTAFAVGAGTAVTGACEGASFGFGTPVCVGVGMVAGGIAGKAGDWVGGYAYRDVVAPTVDFAKSAYSTVSSGVSSAVDKGADLLSDLNPFG
ncbi:MAG: hypothetical protein QOG34_1115, partial [Frankiaceae bacterium]|nr:hypothetical protein [Frankiaceae bacterium]